MDGNHLAKTKPRNRDHGDVSRVTVDSEFSITPCSIINAIPMHSMHPSFNAHLLQNGLVPLCLLQHGRLGPGLPVLVIHPLQAAPRPGSLHLKVPERAAHVALLAGHLDVDGVRGAHVAGGPGHDVDMDVGHRLPRVGAVLHCHREAAGFGFRRGEVGAREEPLDELHRCEEVGCLGGREVRQAFMGRVRADQDVTLYEGLEVDQGEGIWCCEEDLVFVRIGYGRLG